MTDNSPSSQGHSPTRKLIGNINTASFDQVFEIHACADIIGDMEKLDFDIDIGTATQWLTNFSFKASARPVIDHLLFRKNFVNTYNGSAKHLCSIVQNFAQSAMNDFIPIFIDQILFNVKDSVLDSFFKWFMNEVNSNKQWIQFIDDGPLIQIFLIFLRKKPDFFDSYHLECNNDIGLFIVCDVYHNLLQIDSPPYEKAQNHVKNLLHRIDQNWNMQIDSLTQKRNQIQSLFAKEMLQTTGL